MTTPSPTPFTHTMTCLSVTRFKDFEIPRFIPAGTPPPRNPNMAYPIKATGALVGYFQPGEGYEFGLNGRVAAPVAPAPAPAVAPAVAPALDSAPKPA